MLSDCARCAMRDTAACRDCLVTVLLEKGPVDLTDGQIEALGNLAVLEEGRFRLTDDGLWVLDAIRQYRLTATGPWIRRLLDDTGLDREIVDPAGAGVAQPAGEPPAAAALLQRVEPALAPPGRDDRLAGASRHRR